MWLEVERVISPFRASGRFIWLACCVLMAGTRAFVLRSFGRVSGLTLLTACLILQFGDSWKALKKNRSTYNYDYQPVPLNSAFWQTAAEKYKKVLYVPPQDTETNYQQLCYFAASHHLPISLCRYARTDEQKLVATRMQALERRRGGDLSFGHKRKQLPVGGRLARRVDFSVTVV